MTRIGLLTDLASRSLDEDLEPLTAALLALGVDVDPLPWDDPAATSASRLRGFDLVVVRSPWNYHHRADAYLAEIDRMAAVVAVLNEPALLRWNVDKRYLDDLVAAGVPVVPTRFVPPGGDLRSTLEDLAVGASGEFVVKPSVSAGSKNTARFRRTQTDAAWRLVQDLHRLGKTVMVQPYLDRVDSDGETALVYVDGRFSHGLRKGPLLQLDAGLVAGTFAEEEMSGRVPDAAQRQVADRIIAVLVERFGSVPLYARIDLLDDAEGRPVLLEAELNEPSLFHLHAPGSAERFAAAIVARTGDPVRPSRSR